MEGKNTYERYKRIIWTTFFGGLLFIPFFFFLVSLGLLGRLPSSEKIENPKANLASEVFSEDGIVLGKYYTQNRTRVEYEELSPNVVNALIATEDERFRKHSGIDFWGTLRAIVYLGSKGGGSTITQQLALNLFAKRASSIPKRIIQKIKEYVLAVRLEKSYTKDEILALYLNTIDFVNNAVGIKSAANVYFNVEPKELSITQAATLVGMLQNPSLYNPVKRPERALQRRNIVLNQMVKSKYLTAAERDSLMKTPLDLKFNKVDHIEGLAPYFRSTLANELKDWASKNKKADGSNYDIYRDGLKIYTTINSKMQKYAEESVYEHLKEHQVRFFQEHKYSQTSFWKSEQGKVIIEKGMKQSEAYQSLKTSNATEKEIKDYFNTPKEMSIFSYDGAIDTVLSPLDSLKYHKMFLHPAFIVMDPENGHIKAWVGGVDFEYFKFDHAEKNTKRLGGSTFKPILYSLAIDNGWSPCMKINNVPVTIYTETGEAWTPKNAGSYGGWLTLKQCLARSVNTCAAYIMSQIGPGAMVEQAKRMGLQSNPKPVPSLALGTADVSLWEMMQIYSTFVTGGSSTQPIYIDRIEDKNGTVIQRFITERKEVMSEQTAHVMLEMLKGPIDPAMKGTATRIKTYYQIPGDVAGKTGTTNDHTDGWFMGMTPNLMAGVWVGCDDQALRFKTLGNGAGGRMAMPIWGLFFQKVFADKSLNLDPNAKFFIPKAPIDIEMDCAEYERLNPSEVKFPFGDEGSSSETQDLNNEFE
jgi:penicillin-binding protein 1A